LNRHCTNLLIKTVDVSVTVSLHEPYSSLMYTVFK